MNPQDPNARGPRPGPTPPAEVGAPGSGSHGSASGGYDAPSGGYGSPSAGYGSPSAGYGSPSQGGTATLTPPPWTAGPPPAPPRRPWHRRPGTVVAGALVAVLVAGGAGGAVGYEAATTSGGGSSVLASAPTAGAADAPPAPEGSVQAVAQRVLPSVVQLKGASGEGSGIVISADGLILTNAHVLEAGQSRQQESPFGGFGGLEGQGGQGGGQGGSQGGQAPGLTAVFQNGATAPVQVVGTDATADLAVVRAQGVSNLTPAQLGSSGALAVGQPVVAVGSPLGLSGTVTSGIVSALQRPVATGGAGSGQASVLDAIQTDAAINPGNSGGALVDMQGRVVGITSAIASLGSGSSSGGGQQSGSIGLGFAIPIDQAARIGNELATQGFADQAVLGSTVGDASPTGATLGQLTPGGAAVAAGLQPGDVVTRVDDRVVDDADALVAAIRSQKPGAQVTLTVASNGATRQVPVTLGSERAPSA